MSPRPRIQLFGPPSVLDAEGLPIAKLGPGKPLALLAYLLAEGPTSRETVVGLLWGDVPEAKARNAFRQALHRLRSALGEDIIPHDPDMLRISGESPFDSDLSAFETALKQGNAELAIMEYRGDFLAGLDVREEAFDQWVSGKRARLRAQYSDALRSSLQRLLEAGETEPAIGRAASLASSSPSDPEATLLYASTLLGAGRRGEALHALRDFGVRFERDTGAAPPPSIREMEAKLRRTPADTTPGASRAAATFVGRDRELSILLAAWREAERGSGSVIFLDGAAGSGKTRIIEEFFARARDIGSPLLLLGRERAAGSGIAYASIAEALRGTLEAAGVAGTSQHLLAEASRLLPQLRDHFTLPESGDVTDESGRLRFFEGVAALLDSVAYEQPVCVALDDFQNSSVSTIALAYYLADRLRAAPILFLFSGRSDAAFLAAKREFANVARGTGSGAASGATFLDVGALPDESAVQLVNEVTHGKLDGATIQRIVALSEGLPFRVLDLAERAASGAPLGDAPVPLKTVLWTRLQRCNQAEQRLFVAAALIDRPASIRLLASASHLSESNALDAALALEREGLLVQRDEGMTPSHDMAAELALEGTGPAGRALLAGWAAEALARDGSATDAELANLFVAAGRRAEAFLHSRNAGYSAAKSGAFDEAEHHFEVGATTAGSERERLEMAQMKASVKGSSALRLTGEVTNPPPVSFETTAPQPTIESEAPAARTPTEPAQAAQPESAGASLIPKPRRRWARPVLLGVAAASAGLLLVKGISNTRQGAPGTSLRDSLLVAEEISPRESIIAFTTGPLGSPISTLSGWTRNGNPSWIDSLRAPWINPRMAPGGKMVAVEKMTAAGSDLYVITIDRRDTIPVATGSGDDISAGWSPDGRWLLATRGEAKKDAAYVADLFAYSVVERNRAVALDTSGSRSVVEAAWSPDGTHVAWTARSGPTHQQDVFVSDADGSNIRNISADAAEDYSIAWSPDGQTLAFTSERSKFAEIYSVELRTGSLRRLTWDNAHADRAGYSPDGRWLAYESTRGGVGAVYVMPSWGGTGRIVAPGERRVTFEGWRGRAVPYLDQLTIAASDFQNPGTAQLITASGVDQNNHPIQVNNLLFQSLTPSLATLGEPENGSDGVPQSRSARLVANSAGLVRVAVSAGGWRADTAFVSIGSEALSLVQEDFETALDGSRWIGLGMPRPEIVRGQGEGGSSGLLARSDRQWESGLLSTRVLPMRAGLTVESWVRAPFSAMTSAGTAFSISLVAADPAGVPDSTVPEFFRLASVSWLGEAGRMSYAVDREIFTEPVGMLSPGTTHHLMLRIEPDGAVAFFIDGTRRWKSTLKVRVSGPNSRAQLWLSSQSTPSEIAFDNVTVSLGAGKTAAPAGVNR